MIIGWIALGMFVLCGGGCVTALVIGARTTPSGSGSTYDGPGASRTSPAPIGTQISPAKDWDITVLSADIDADAEMAAASSFNKPDAGKRYVTAKVKIDNRGKEAESVLLNLDVHLLDSKGATIQIAFSSLPDRLDIATQLQPGGTVTGTLVFEVPIAEADKVVLLVEPTYSFDKLEDQRFLAVK